MFSRAPEPASALPDIRLTGTRVSLRPPRQSDWHEWAMLRSHNSGFLQPWEPTWDPDCLTEEYYDKRFRRQVREWRDDRTYPFLITLHDSDALIGAINLNNISRGAGQQASLGYWIGENHQRHGYMTEAGRLIMEFAFTELKLHRLNAGTLPENTRSRSMLTRLGFKEEGFAARYIQIDGLWRDHVLYGLPIEDWEARDILA